MLPWTYKYEPNSISDIAGQPNIPQLLKCIKNKQQGTLLFGPTGTGKTSSIHAIAKELNLEILELNASDLRNKDSIKSIIGTSSQQLSLFNKEKIILIDEIDGLSRRDRGALQELSKIIQQTKYPIILICNDPYNKKFKDIKKKCALIEFSNISNLDIVNQLKKICEKESINYDEEILKNLARKSNGDLRSAINDAYTLSIINNNLETDEYGFRDKITNLQDQMRLVFKSKNAKDVISAFDSVPEDFNTVMLWMDYNLPYEYKKTDLAKAYDAISKADVYFGRIRRWQYWRYLVYIKTYLTAGIALAKKEKTPGFIPYKQTTRLLQIWQAKMKYGKKRAIAEKFASYTHQSIKNSINTFQDYKTFIKFDENIQNEIELSEDEKKYLLTK